ncbi:MAG: 50S ribosomal protein L13 [Candidatus Altiarchaeales archaeon A3]|nr:MAG: 50S ribosomal protein L13 [Candidatus Altiarchaeales archaeon A3]
MIVNAEGQILGRMASFVAKRALRGDRVVVVNAEKALISGTKTGIQTEVSLRLGIRNWGNPKKGPFMMKQPDNFVRSVIRGMLPYNKNRYGPRGRAAFKEVIVFMGVPQKEIEKFDKSFNQANIDEISGKNLQKKPLRKYVYVSEFCKKMGYTEKK